MKSLLSLNKSKTRPPADLAGALRSSLCGTWTAALLALPLLLGGCGEGEDPGAAGDNGEASVAEELAEESAPKKIRERGSMDLYIDGVATAVEYGFSRYLEPEEEGPAAVALYGANMEVHGVIDADGDGSLNAQDHPTSGWPLTPGQIVGKTIVLRQHSEEEPCYVVVPEEGRFTVAEGKMLVEEYEMGNPMAGEAPTWSCAVELTAVDEAGESQQAYGRLQGTLMDGNLRPKQVAHLKAHEWSEEKAELEKQELKKLREEQRLKRQQRKQANAPGS